MARLSLFERTLVTRLLNGYCSDELGLASSAGPRYSFAIRGTAVTLIEEQRSLSDPAEWIQSSVAQFRRAPTHRV